jgi:hypothetical protein
MSPYTFPEESMRPSPPAAALVLALLLAGCGGRPATTPADAGADVFIPAPPADELDILAVLDNGNGDFGDSGLTTMAFAALLAPLAAAHPGLSVHLGVVTSDLGAGVYTPPSCDVLGGDQGILFNRQQARACDQAHLTDPSARFATFTLAADASAIDANFVGTPEGVFDCYRGTGVGGCGFEHVLGALRVALDGCDTAGGCTQPANAGFLRPDAYLLLLVFSSEDDCSAPPDSELFDTSLGQVGLNSHLGPLTSYRCFELGVLCGGQGVARDSRSYASCAPGNKDAHPTHQLVPVATFARDFEALKAAPRMVYTAVFAGPPTPVQVGLDANGYPDLQPSCRGAATAVWRSAADPGIRLEAFTRQFAPDRARFFNACTTDPNEAFSQIGADLATALRGD